MAKTNDIQYDPSINTVVDNNINKPTWDDFGLTSTLTTSTKKSKKATNNETYSTANSSIDVESLLTTNMKGVFGMPYQFMPSVDRRIDTMESNSDLNSMGKCSSFGRKYAEKIVSRMPLLFLTPGRPAFLKGFDSDSRGLLAEWVEDTIKGADIGDVGSVISKSGKFYSFEFAYAEYYKYVNSLLNPIAVLLGIGDVKIPYGNGTKHELATFEWERAVNNDFKGTFSAKESVPFYIDSENSISETFSNSSTDSSLAGKVNEKASEMREYKYIVNGIAGMDTWSSFTNLFSGLTSSMAGSDTRLLQAAGAGLDAVANGGKLIFPKMWDDSDFSRSYNIEFKFRSPDHDTLSIFLNILVPYFHLVAMAAPHQSVSINGLEAPFLVRGFYKGFFNCDMGLISSLSCTKGAEGQWNNDGLPTVMDVTITLEDLYSNMSISNAFGDGDGPIRGTISQKSVKEFIQNTNLIDYLCMTCALNLNTPEVERLVSVYAVLSKAKYLNYPNRVFTSLEEAVSNKISDIYSFLKVF